YAALFTAAARLARRRGPAIGILLVFASAVTAALLALLHAAAAADRLYGLYAPLAARPPWSLAPLLNPNNLAGYLNLGFFCGAGWLVTARRAGPRLVAALLAAVTLAVSVLSGSRAGLVSLLLGLGLLAPALWRSARAGDRPARRRLATAVPVLGAALAGASFFLLGATPRVLRDLLDETTGKLLLAAWTRPLIADHLWFGVGRGAYETAFPPYRIAPGHVVYQYAENFVVQWLAEWGLVVALAALAGLAWTLRPGQLRAGRHPVTASAAVGLIALAVQNLFDLGLELASIGFAVATVLGSLWGAARAAEAPRAAPGADGVHPRLTAPAVGLAVLGGAALVAAAALGTRPVENERHRLQAAFLATSAADPAGLARFSGELAAAVRAHPGDPFLPLLGALQARRRGDSPLPWLNQALERDPSAGRPYLLLAQTLARRGFTGQALLAAGQAAERDPALARAAATAAIAATHDPEALLRAAPAGSAGNPFLTACAGALPLERAGAARLALLEATVSRAPDDPQPRRELARTATALLGQRAPGAPCLDGGAPRCRALIEEQAAALERLRPDEPDGTLARAELLLATDRAEAARALLVARCERWPTSAACQRLLAEAADRSGDLELMAAAAERLLAASCGARDPCAAAAREAAQRQVRRGGWHEAARYFERAARESDAAADWEGVADAAIRAGELARAVQAVAHARRAGSARAAELEERLDAARRGRILEGAGTR
ncbi:MAG TPA: O-antigen ligase family protein, partial [Polyangiaceae bacterium]|nr:O-antigen ligase family protein [Polyangiaceae bacterium]